MSSELMKLVEEMRESINSPYWPRDDQMIDWSDRLEAIAKAQGEAAAWVTPLRHGQQVTFYKPPKPDNGFGYEGEQEWYCYPLYRVAQPSPAADVLAEALKEIAAADQGEGGCYYTNRSNIELARNALAAYEKERQK